ncbi:hypothetical protein KDA_37400 [Dictyobacter alpinus]|uniref:Uncharacterized protein n=1 Tax=Dictyobacter alpinus TaxID=2014873 RepID=A0A402BAB5_9CHLR|nr:hypothetical protein KDA_37400 [Dictyobacter alpinus]
MGMNGRPPISKRIGPRASRVLLRIVFALVVSGILVLAFFATNALSH